MGGGAQQSLVWPRLLRLLPPGTRGKSRLARLLLGQALKEKDAEIETPDGCTFIVPSLAEPVAFHLLIDGVYEPNLLQLLQARLRPGGVFVDVGANVGAFTVPAARHVGPSGLVLAVEASPRVFPYLKRNIEANGLQNVRLKNCAACASDGREVSFYDAPGDHFGMGSMAPQFGSPAVKVAGRTLDQLLAEECIANIDLLKVDVEGFEHEVFRGASSLLASKDPPAVVFEFCDWAEKRATGGEAGAAQRVLQEFGYHLFLLKDAGRVLALTTPVTEGFKTVVAVRG